MNTKLNQRIFIILVFVILTLSLLGGHIYWINSQNIDNKAPKSSTFNNQIEQVNNELSEINTKEILSSAPQQIDIILTDIANEATLELTENKLLSALQSTPYIEISERTLSQIKDNEVASLVSGEQLLSIPISNETQALYQARNKYEELLGQGDQIYRDNTLYFVNNQKLRYIPHYISYITSFELDRKVYWFYITEDRVGISKFFVSNANFINPKQITNISGQLGSINSIRDRPGVYTITLFFNDVQRTKGVINFTVNASEFIKTGDENLSVKRQD